jgi:transposase-like protein
MRKTFEAGLKARVALDAVKGEKTLAELSAQYGVHANMIVRWKREMLDRLPGIFDKKAERRDKAEAEEKVDALYKTVGELKLENDWLKKKLQQLG